MESPAVSQRATCNLLNEEQFPRDSPCEQFSLSAIPCISIPLELDTLFNERYVVLEKIGSGGFASVYKARDIQERNRLVAIKEISLRYLEPQAKLDAVDAFQREITFLSKLTHPALPQIYEYYQSPEHLYLVLNYIEGETLEAFQERHTTSFIPLTEIFSIALQLCAILEYLHTRHPPVVFRDLKPGNIIRTLQGQLYLIDFGIARHFKPGQSKDTTALGSLGYAAPEQFGRAQTTPRTDIYSLGAILHQLLSGEDPSEHPFRFSPLRVNADLSISRLGGLITCMVDIDASKRPISIAIVQQELQRLSNIWKATVLRFWQPGPEHNYRLTNLERSYRQGYQATRSRVH